MNRFVKLIMGIVFSLSGLHAASAFAHDDHVGVSRINCVIETDGAIVCHDGCNHPCIAFFDVTSAAGSNLNAMLLKHLVDRKIIAPEATSIKLELFGVSDMGSVHHHWRKVKDKDINLFWENITGLSHPLKVSRDLNQIHIGALRFASYIFKVSYSSSK